MPEKDCRRATSMLFEAFTESIKDQSSYGTMTQRKTALLLAVLLLGSPVLTNLNNPVNHDLNSEKGNRGGKVYYLKPFGKLNLTEARQACQSNGDEIATVKQLYAAWRQAGLDHCSLGWLDDGSVGYAFTMRCRKYGLSKLAIRIFGFQPPEKKYGVYCYKSG